MTNATILVLKLVRYTNESILEKNRPSVINAAIVVMKLVRRNYTCASKLDWSVINATILTKELVGKCTSESTLESSRSSVIGATFLAKPPAV